MAANNKQITNKKTVTKKPTTKAAKKPAKKQAKTNKPITVTAYARHRKEKNLKGTTRQAVKKAIDAARLMKCVVLVGKKQMITDAAAADKEWLSKTTPDTTAPTEPVTPKKTEEQIQLDLESQTTSRKFTNARATRLDAQAEMALIELAKAQETVLDLVVAKREVLAIGKTLSKNISVIGRAHAEELAQETDPQKVRIKINAILNGLIETTVYELGKIA